MQRRTFLKSAGSLVAASSLSAAAHAAAPASSRVILSLNRNWRFHPAKIVGAELTTFDDSSFEDVVLPHTDVKLPWHNFDDALYEFVSTYRRRFSYPAEARGQRVFVDFEGAMTASTVWINGTLLGAVSRRSPLSSHRISGVTVRTSWWCSLTRPSAPTSRPSASPPRNTGVSPRTSCFQALLAPG